MKKREDSVSQALSQVWFPGGHGCVGGGTVTNRGLSDGALKWMIAEVNRIGLKLEFNLTRIEENINPTSDFNNDPGFYRLAGTMHRTIAPEAQLHESVQQRWCARPDYRPENLAAHRKALELSCHR